MSAAVYAARDDVPVARACDALGLSRATLYRDARPRAAAAAAAAAPRVPRAVPRRLSAAERDAVVDVLHREEFVDQPPGEIVATLLSRGEYVASVRTFYRILAAADEARERRAQRRHPPATKPTLTATAPNQVWTWDITKVAGPAPGVWFYVYVLIDLFSRYVVGWLVAPRERGRLAAAWLREVLVRHGVDPTTLVVHNDRGSPMTSVPFTQLCTALGLTQSFSRPRVSNDNPVSEAQFKTLKYQPDFPDRFGSQLHVAGWMGEYFGWYNDHHHHAGLAMFTPADVFFGRVPAIAAARQAALDAAFAAHPERFVKGPPRVALPPPSMTINPTPAATTIVASAHVEGS